MNGSSGIGGRLSRLPGGLRTALILAVWCTAGPGIGASREAGDFGVTQDTARSRSVQTRPLGIVPEPGDPLAALVRAWREGHDPAVVGEIADADRRFRAPDRWSAADLDGDGRDEWIAVLEPRLCDRSPLLWIVGFGGSVARRNACVPLERCDRSCRVVGAADLTGEGRDDVVVETVVRGAHTETMLYRVYGIQSGLGPDPRPGLHSLVAAQVDGETPGLGIADAVEMTYARVRLKDETGDGTADLVVTGGLIGSAGAGDHQRERTEIWTIRGRRIRLYETRLAPTDLRIFLLYEANDAMAEGRLAAARILYRSVVNDASLRDVENLFGEPTGPLVRQYAAFRLVHLALLRGGGAAVRHWLDWFGRRFSDSAIARAAETLVDLWSEGPSTACGRVRDQLEDASMSWRPIEEMGYANPRLDAASLCPRQADWWIRGQGPSKIVGEAE